MADAFDYQTLYDHLREHGYHEPEDNTSHLVPYVDWLRRRTAYRSVLDIGCSIGGSFAALAADGEQVAGVDVSSLAVKRAQLLGRDVRHASATSLPFADSSFDLVASADVFEHLCEADVAGAAREAIRVARKFVFMKIAVHEDATQRWKQMAGHPLHLTVRPISWWKSHFEFAGAFIRSEDEVICLQLTDEE